MHAILCSYTRIKMYYSKKYVYIFEFEILWLVICIIHCITEDHNNQMIFMIFSFKKILNDTVSHICYENAF